MNLVIREKIIILTSGKWVEKFRLAGKIKEAIGPKKCTVIHYDELRRQTIVSLGERYTEERALARFTESLARSISAALMCDSTLILDTDISTIHEFKILVRLIEYVYGQIADWYEEQYRLMSKGDKEYKRIEAQLKAGPPSVLLIKVLAEKSVQEKNISHFFKECRDELYSMLGDEGLAVSQILETGELENIEHERVKYGGLYYYENRTSKLSIREAKVKDGENVVIFLDL